MRDNIFRYIESYADDLLTGRRKSVEYRLVRSLEHEQIQH
jgi:hypothetical protein